jgi:presenilin-like A22 family membrane protease
MKVVLGFLGLLIGALIGLFGLFLILYRGEEGSEGDVYMNFGAAGLILTSSVCLSWPWASPS